jgi:hypothetical protein
VALEAREWLKPSTHAANQCSPGAKIIGIKKNNRKEEKRKKEKEKNDPIPEWQFDPF